MVQPGSVNIAQNVIVFRDKYLHFIDSRHLALEILESLCRFQLLTIKRLDTQSKSQGTIEITIVHYNLRQAALLTKRFTNLCAVIFLAQKTTNKLLLIKRHLYYRNSFM